jgi:TetR/AcrR family transcriptional repressor of lmrAB and yxaGH operons
MTSSPPSTRDRLIRSAATIFRDKGYHGTGLAEILADAGVPKGSLYHHFPNGKSDLAIAAADLVSSVTLSIIDDSFHSAESYQDGAATFCFKLAKLFEISDWKGCPVNAVLFDSSDNAAFRDRAEITFQSWIDRIAQHAERFGMAPETAAPSAEALLICIEGGWILARARGTGDTLRRVPQYLFPAEIPPNQAKA